MDIMIAWEKFKNTGKITDYLEYSKAKLDNMKDGENSEFEYRWSNNSRKKRF